RRGRNQRADVGPFTHDYGLRVDGAKARPILLALLGMELHDPGELRVACTHRREDRPLRFRGGGLVQMDQAFRVVERIELEAGRLREAQRALDPPDLLRREMGTAMHRVALDVPGDLDAL